MVFLPTQINFQSAHQSAIKSVTLELTTVADQNKSPLLCGSAFSPPNDGDLTTTNYPSTEKSSLEILGEPPADLTLFQTQESLEYMLQQAV
jgi:hypothetical protein